MRYESFGPVFNSDGSPTEFTKQMLAGTGRDVEELRPKQTLYCANDRHDDCGGKIGISGGDSRPDCQCGCH